MTFFKLEHNELQLPSGEPQPLPYIHIIIYIDTHNIYIYTCMISPSTSMIQDICLNHDVLTRGGVG